jgi:hypothetical protein
MKTRQILAGVPNVDTFLSEWLPQLQQAPQIKTEDAINWHSEMSQRDAVRFAWHFKRLSGILPSEIGEVAQRSMGYAETNKDVELIIDQKLMRALPDEFDNRARRDFLAEPMIASIFKQDYKAVTQHSVMKEIGTHRISWLVGNVTDVVEINGVIGCVDYRIADVVPDGMHLIHQAQLQAYDYLLADNRSIAHIAHDELEQRIHPLAFDFMLNVYLDFANGTVKPIRVPYDGKLMRIMIDAGDAVWHHIKKGGPLPDWFAEEHPGQCVVDSAE